MKTNAFIVIRPDGPFSSDEMIIVIQMHFALDSFSCRKSGNVVFMLDRKNYMVTLKILVNQIEIRKLVCILFRIWYIRFSKWKYSYFYMTCPYAKCRYKVEYSITTKCVRNDKQDRKKNTLKNHETETFWVWRFSVFPLVNEIFFVINT